MTFRPVQPAVPGMPMYAHAAQGGAAPASSGGATASLGVVRLKRNTDLSVSDTTATVAAWDAVDVSVAGPSSVGGAWSSATPTRLIVPAGYTKARIAAKALFHNVGTTGDLVVAIPKNGTTSRVAGRSMPAAYTTQGEQILETDSGWLTVVAGDYFEMTLFQSSGATQTCYFTPSTSYYGWSYMQAEFLP